MPIWTRKLCRRVVPSSRLAGLFLCLFLAPSLFAAELSEGLRLNGFYTLGAIYSDSPEASVPTQTEPDLLGKDQLSLDGSLFGLQLDYSATDRLDFTLQAISGGQEDFDPRLEWAYLNYDLGNDYHLRAGQMKLSLLQGTELRYVGFSRLWARPLVTQSGASGFDDYTGFDLLKTTELGEYNLTLQASYGRAEHHQSFIDNRDVKLLLGQIEKDGSWVKASLMHARYDMDTASGRQLRDNASLYMASIETELWFNAWQINAGLAAGSGDFVPHDRLAYLSLGYRLGDLTPYIMGTRVEQRFDSSEYTALLPPPPMGPPPMGPPPGGTPPGGGLREGTDTRDTLAIGLRYDLGDRYAVKLQLEHWQNDLRSYPNRSPEQRDGNLFTLSVEGVF